MQYPPVILVATLGASWPVIPEVLATLAPSVCPLYVNHPQAGKLQELRKQCSLSGEISELWVITSSSAVTHGGITSLREWHRHLPGSARLKLRFFIAAGTDQVTTPQELQCLQELIFRVVLLANETGQVICSLAGGRKTMSADLQRAASIFGADGLLHIVAPEPLPVELKDKDHSFWASPMPAPLAGQLLPAFVGRYTRRDTLDIEADGGPVESKRFALPAAAEDTVWFALDARSLVAAVEKREQDAQQLWKNYLANIAGNERHENWRHLYRLAPRQINRLRQTVLSNDHAELLRSLPKAELHCHLGGIPTLEQQKAIGLAIWNSMSAEARQAAQQAVAPLLGGDLQAHEWVWNWPDCYLKAETCHQRRAERAAALLVCARPETLEYNLFTVTGPRVALQESTHGFAAYERPGVLAGSAILGHAAALHPYAKAIEEYVAGDNIVYLELRGSPHKYSATPVEWLKAFRKALPDSDQCRYRFIWILDRRQPDVRQQIEAILAARLDLLLEGFLVGVDIAGDENRPLPPGFEEQFAPLFKECLPVTIHAGEGTDVENIWSAAYRLHADRIGHGLLLADNPALQERFRNRGICLELCPGSNREVVGFCDPVHPETAHRPVYPLATLWREGIALCINTDNPGITRTTLSEEFIAASRMCEITLWEALAIHKQGFLHALADAKTREHLSKQADAEIFQIINHWLTCHE